MNRDPFLAAVRTAVTASRLPEVPADDPGLHVPDLAEVDMLAAFGGALEKVSGELHDGPALETVLEIARSHGADTFLSWDDARLPIDGVVAGLEAAGFRRLDAEVPRDERREHQMSYLDVVLGVTGAEAGFAETGTIVVRSGPGRPRMASLIPTVHVALLPRGAIHRSLAHWAHGAAPSLATDTNVVFITGVSRTGDIEMRLNTGVHGPEYVHVILV